MYSDGKIIHNLNRYSCFSLSKAKELSCSCQVVFEILISRFTKCKMLFGIGNMSLLSGLQSNIDLNSRSACNYWEIIDKNKFLYGIFEITRSIIKLSSTCLLKITFEQWKFKWFPSKIYPPICSKIPLSAQRLTTWIIAYRSNFQLG